MSAIIKQAIQKSPIFEHLDKQWRQRLVEAAQIRTFSGAETIIEQGKEVASLFIVLSGEVRVWSRIDERVVELETLGPGAYFGEVSLLSSKAATASVQAREAQVGTLAIGRAILLELLDDDQDTRRILEDSTLKRAKDTIGKILK